MRMQRTEEGKTFGFCSDWKGVKRPNFNLQIRPMKLRLWYRASAFPLRTNQYISFSIETKLLGKFVCRNTARIIHVIIDPVNCFDKVFRFSFEDILYVLLWITCFPSAKFGHRKEEQIISYQVLHFSTATCFTFRPPRTAVASSHLKLCNFNC